MEVREVQGKSLPHYYWLEDGGDMWSRTQATCEAESSSWLTASKEKMPLVPWSQGGDSCKQPVSLNNQALDENDSPSQHPDFSLVRALAESRYSWSRLLIYRTMRQWALLEAAKFVVICYPVTENKYKEVSNSVEMLVVRLLSVASKHSTELYKKWVLVVIMWVEEVHAHLEINQNLAREVIMFYSR